MIYQSIMESLNVGDLIEVKTELKGRYPCKEMSQIERDGGPKIMIDPAPSLSISGKFHKILIKDSDQKEGPFVDNYLQVEIYGERAVYRQYGDGFRITGWEYGNKILSIPFRNITSVKAKI